MSSSDISMPMSHALKFTEFLSKLLVEKAIACGEMYFFRECCMLGKIYFVYFFFKSFFKDIQCEQDMTKCQDCLLLLNHK